LHKKYFSFGFCKSAFLLKLNRYYFISLVYLAKANVQIFNTPQIKQRLIQHLTEMPDYGLHVKKAAILSLFLVNVLSKLYSTELHWPVEFIRVRLFFNNKFVWLFFIV